MSVDANATRSFSVVETSQSKKSLILDQGSLNGVQVGEEGEFYFQEGVNKPKLIRIGVGKAVKVLPNYSFWYLLDIENMDYLVPQTKVIFLGDADAMRGRRPLKIKNRVRANSMNRPNATFLKNDYNASKDILGTDKQEKGFDKTITKTIEWEDDGKREMDENGEELKLKKISIPSFSKENKEMRDNNYIEVASSTTSGSVEKINKNESGLTSFYLNQKRDPNIRWLRDEGWYYNAYRTYKYDKRKDVEISPQAKAKMEREGDMWSADLDDEALREFVVKNGLTLEKEKQKFAFENRIGNELIFRYQWNTTPNTTQDDLTNQGQGYSLIFGYEYHLMRAIKSLENWSIDAFWEQGLDYFNVGGVNAKAQYALLGGYVNYYFYNEPSSIKKFIFYGGAGLKFGSANLSQQDLTQEYAYTMKALPSYQIGLKYRFDPGDEVDEGIRVGMGINFVVQVSLLSLNASDEILDDINGTIEGQETKFGLGMVFIF